MAFLPQSGAGLWLPLPYWFVLDLFIYHILHFISFFLSPTLLM
jgi:hypothetical protein